MSRLDKCYSHEKLTNKKTTYTGCYKTKFIFKDNQGSSDLSLVMFTLYILFKISKES